MQTLSLWIKKYFYPLLLTFLVGILVGANYTRGTILSGWDTLHPEFNISVAFSRLFIGVWRSDQGLGAVAGHSHMAGLPHTIIVWILSMFQSVDLVRYSFVFLCMLSGVLGAYTLLKHLFTKQRLASFLAFIGALVYLTNLGTVQQFIVPFEMFTVQYAILPWILFSATRYLQMPTRKNMLWFMFTILLASPMAYAATLWYAFFALFALYILWIDKGLKLILITLFTNLYWILPNIYFVFFHGKDVELSKVNRLFSPEAFAKNQEFGTLLHLPLVKNFLFDWKIYSNETATFTNVMAPWQSHLHNPLVVCIGIAMFIIAVMGAIRVMRQKNKIGQAFAIIFFLSGLMLLNGTWPMTVIFDSLGRLSGVAKEALRFPFTKFSIFYTLSMSVLVGYGLDWLLSKLTRKIALTFLGIVFAGLIYFFIPAFTGNLIQPAMRITIPKEYFDMFGWFATQPKDGRVAILPIHSFWNWTYYRWGYQGAGFLQFGIPQPILDRDYDRWSPHNELYAREMSYAIYSQNPDNIRNVLTKYNVTWVLVDNSIFAPSSNENQTLLWMLPELLTRAGLSQVKTFGDHIAIYKTGTANAAIVSFTSLPSVGHIIPYSLLINNEERLTQAIPGTIVSKYGGRSFRSIDVSQTDHVDLPALDHAKSYVLEITSKHASGFPLQLCVSNNLTSHCDLSVHLGKQSNFLPERFLLPKLNDFGTGYNLNFNNFTIRGMTSINEIQSIVVTEVPQEPEMIDQTPPTPITQEVREILPILYRVKIKEPTNSLVLLQSFEQGWIAYNPGDRKVYTHVLVNNWANGWTGNFGTSDIIYIMFWPQLLEWVGFASIPVAIWLLYKKYEVFS